MARRPTPTPVPEIAPAAQEGGRQFPVDAILGRYRQALAQATERAIIAEATAAAAEAECSSLRLALVEAQEALADDAG